MPETQKKPTKPKSIAAYKKQIKKCCVEAGTYRPFFDYAIQMLAEVLHKRDQALRQYEDEFDAQPVITYTNKAGATNPVKNPALAMWNDLNNTALSYWRELGLTPAGLKKIDEKAMKPKKKSALSEALSDLG